MFKKLLAVALAAVLAAVVSLPSMAASPPSLDQVTMSFDIDKTKAMPGGDTLAVNDAQATAASGSLQSVLNYSEKPPTAGAGTMVAAKSKGKKKSKRSVLEVPSQSRSPA